MSSYSYFSFVDKVSKKVFALAVFGVLFALSGSGQPLAFAANAIASLPEEEIVNTFYFPTPEKEIHAAITGVVPGNTYCHNSGELPSNWRIREPSNPIYSYTSIVIGFDSTIVYYDHWEDGYEADIYNTTANSTQAWGDADPSNGYHPDFPSDVFSAGDVLILETKVRLNKIGSSIIYDGGDKIQTTDTVQVNRMGWLNGSGTLLAGALEVYPTNIWGTEYIAPVGVDTISGLDDAFQYSAMSIMASIDDTEIRKNGQLVATLVEGESVLLEDIAQGDTITSSYPVQANLLTGDVCSYYEGRWYTLLHTDMWSHQYYTPVSSQGVGDPDPTWIYLYNPNADAITVDWTNNQSAQAAVNIAPGAAEYVVVTQGASEFHTNDESPFYAIALIDADGNASHNNGLTHDWGYTLTPLTSLTPQFTVGYAPGDDPTYTRLSENSSPVWFTAVYPPNVTPAGDITVCIDYLGDGGALGTAPYSYDKSLTVAPLTQTKLYTDLNDDGIADNPADQTGTRVWTCDDKGALLSAAYGQDPATSRAGSPAIDVGYGIPNAPTQTLSKSAVQGTDLNDNGLYDIGDTIQYTLTIKNKTAVAMPQSTMATQDDLPEYVTYIENSTTVNGQAIADAGTTPFPLDEDGYRYGEILNPDDTYSIAYEVEITSRPADDLICNVATETNEFLASGMNTISDMACIELVPLPGPEPAAPAALVVDKEANAYLVNGGDRVTYTVTITNVGDGAAHDVTIDDVLPSNMFYVPNTSALDGNSIADPVDNVWTLADPIPAQASVALTYEAAVNSAQAGQAYVNVATVNANDGDGNAVPKDQRRNFPTDTDPTDDGTATVYGPLVCDTDSRVVAFEDLKNTGWSDWDYNDVVIEMQLEVCQTAEGNIAVMRGEYEIVARGAGYDHAFRHALPYSGSGNYYIIERDGDGNIVREVKDTFETAEFELLSNTRTALPSSASWASNTPSDQDERIYGHSVSLLVTLDEPSRNPAIALPGMPYDPYIYVYDTDEEVHLMIAGHMDNAQTVNATYDPESPMLGQDLPLAQSFPAQWRWPEEFIGIWKGYPDYTTYINTGGTANTNWNLLERARGEQLWGVDADGNFTILGNAITAEPTTRYYANLVSADLDLDGEQEVIIGNYASNTLEVYSADGDLTPLWSRDVTADVKTEAVVTNLDADEELEVLVGSMDGKVYAYHHDGTPVSGWPVDVTGAGYRILARPAVANIDGDADMEIIVAAANGRLYVLEHTGAAKWDASIGAVAEVFDNQLINSAPVVADIDENGTLEIVVGGYDGQLYVLDTDGNTAWLFETEDPILVQPLVADIDPTSPGKEIVFASADSSEGYPRTYLYMLAADGTFKWRTFASWTGVESSPIAGDVDDNGDLEILMGTNDGELRIWNHDGSDYIWNGGSVSAPIIDSPTMGDIDGDGDTEVVAASDDGNIYAWEANGDLVVNWPHEAGIAVKGTPLLLNVDEDPALEAIYADFGGNIDIIGMLHPAAGGNQVFLPMVMAP